jgi:Lrp/AsnC family transcriptional regulator, leucine-responsive regulatory protein
MEKSPLDVLDKKLLFELDNNSRQSISQLSRKLRQGRDRVGYRLERLISEKIIKECTVTINPYRLGFTLFKTYLKVSKRKDRYEALLKLLLQHPRVYWIADCDGRWDLIFATFAKTPYEFLHIQNKILSVCNDIVLSFTNLTLVNVWMFRKNYLVQRDQGYFLIGGPPSDFELERFDWEILRHLSKSARIPIAELARKVQSTESIVRNRLEHLEESGLVAGYRIELDLAKLGMLFFKAQLYLQEYGNKEIESLRVFCAEHPNITYFIEQIGDAPVEIELEVDGYEQYTRIIDSLRITFPKTIRNVETVIIHRTRFKWVPYDEIGA